MMNIKIVMANKFYKASDTRFDPMGHSNRHTMSEYDGVHMFILF